MSTHIHIVLVADTYELRRYHNTAECKLSCFLFSTCFLLIIINYHQPVIN